MQLLNNLFYFNDCNGYVCLLYFYRICLLYFFFLKRVSRYIFICILTSYIVFPQIRGEPSFYKLCFHRFPPIKLLFLILNSIEIVMITCI